MSRRRTLEDNQERAKTLIERRRSKIHGWGVFAKTQIKRSTKIINYAGEKITQNKLTRLSHAIQAYQQDTEQIDSFRIDSLSVFLKKNKPMIEHFKGIHLD